jgi:hypothetical protein
MNRLILLIPIIIIILVSCTKEEIPNVPADSVSFIPFSSSPSLIANGDTAIEIQLKTEYPSIITQASLTTNLGEFINDDATINVLFDKSGIATAYLKSNTVGKATIIATTTFKTLPISSDVISFITSYPDRINLNNNVSMTNELQSL